MKTRAAIVRAQLGITQHEMARLLCISPSAWSMYESGLRGLPTAAMLLLAEMLTAIASDSKTSKTTPKGNENSEAQRLMLEKLLRENEYQQLLLAREIHTIQTKQETATKREQMEDFLNSRNTKDGKPGDAVLFSKKGRVQDSNSRMLLLERNKALLEFEKTWLESRIGEIG